MKIWVDADACPQAVKHILYKAANRKKMPLILVANHYFQTPPSPYIQTLQVEQGFDIADDYIVKQVSDLDLVITADIPLADEAISKGARVMTPRGEILDKENIKARLTFRDLSDNLRASGIQSKGPAPLNNKDIQKFANGLDRILARSKP